MEKITAKRKRLWDRLAKDHAMSAISTSKADWDMEEFFERGKRLVESFCLPFFREVGFNPAGKRMLDLGCGIGRTTRFFTELFAEACGVDISEEMINLARNLNQDKPNLRFDVGNGFDLGMYEDNQFDFVFCYLIFQHISSRKIIRLYIGEIDRVLKPDGLFQLQFNTKEWFHALGFLPIHRPIYN